MAQDPQERPNIVNIAEARKRQKTLRVEGAQRGPGKAQDKRASHGSPKGRKIWAYLQFLLFLLVLAYFMQLCSGRH